MKSNEKGTEKDFIERKKKTQKHAEKKHRLVQLKSHRKENIVSNKVRKSFIRPDSMGEKVIYLENSEITACLFDIDTKKRTRKVSLAVDAIDVYAPVCVSVCVWSGWVVFSLIWKMECNSMIVSLDCMAFDPTLW